VCGLFVTSFVALLLCQLSDTQRIESSSEQQAASAWLAPAVSASPAQTAHTFAVIAPTFDDRWEGLPQVPERVVLPADSPDRFVLSAARLASHAESSLLSGGPQHQDATTGLISYATEDSSEAAPASLAAWNIASPALDVPRMDKHPDRHLLPSVAQLLRRRIGCDLGIGHERVMFAPHVVETAVGTSNTSLLMRADRGLSTPDRLEMIWATPSRGPTPESRVDILDTIFRMELGNEKLLVMTDYTLRSLNPDRNDNTTGFGDMTLGVKTTVHDGQSTKVASVFRTYLKTGPSDRGLGTGHVSLEPGFLLRHQWNEHTYFHGEAKYWLPIAGTPGVAGDVLKLGAALSTVWKETDTVALLPTLEFSSYTFLAGSATRPDGIRRRVNGEFAGELYPGLRCVHGPGNEMGLLEYGVATGFVFADEGWFDTRLVFDIRLAR
jgi:hypothetical protein